MIEPVALVNKQLVASGFGRAAESYDGAAHFQQQVAAEVYQRIPESLHPGVVVDLGSGTGMHTARLLDEYSAALVIGCDLSWGMLKHAKSRCSMANWCGGDAEALPFRNGSVDLVFSSLAIQWCDAFERVLSEVYRVMRPGGCFVFSTLCEGTLGELHHAWQGVDDFEHVNPYPAFEEHHQAISQSGFEVESLDLIPHQVFYNRLGELTRELEALGANTLTVERRQGLMTPGRYRALQQGYEMFRNDQKLLPATYQVLFSVLRKKG